MIVKHIPNSITSLNLVSGCISIVFALNGQYSAAALFILLAAIFDFMDGFAARLLKAYSPIGKELDSLADIVSFGVAPGMIIFQFMKELSETSGDPYWIAWFAFLIPVFSALRLAKFNLDERQTTSFLGLPTPANALFWSFGIGFTYDKIAEFPPSPWFILPFIFLFSWLLISEIPMFSLKFKHFRWKGNRQQYIFLIVCLLLIILLGPAGLSACILWYIILSFLSQNFVKKEK